MKFGEKYYDVIADISRAENADMSVAEAMLRSSVKGLKKMTYTSPNGEEAYDIYKGIPVDFDYEACYEDMLVD